MSVIDEMVCFSVYSASHAFTQAYRRALAPWRLTYPQYLVLVALWDRAPRSVKDLGAELQLDSGTLSPLLRRLEARELITRARQVGDERVVEISLTQSGQALQTEMRGVAVDVARCTGLKPERARDLLAAVHEMTDTLRQATEASASR